MIVVDATVWVDYLTGVLGDDHRETLLVDDPVSPPHVDFEVGSALLRKQRRGELGTRVTAQDLQSEFAAMPFDRERDVADFAAAFELLENATYADALYVAMARRLGFELMTSDTGMAECARIHGVSVRRASDAAADDDPDSS